MEEGKEEKQSQMSRRDFLASAAVVTSVSAAAAVAASFGWRFLYPAEAQAPMAQVLATSITKLPPGTRKTMELAGNEVVLINMDGKVRALSTVCTHLGCRAAWQDARQQFVCPCHIGIYDADGKVVAGPPPRALDEFPVEVKGNNIYVSVPQKE
ncbi:MAG: Rieske (2Fe-2S) protein [Chloroflexi bacterium]|nr:Rieske (2Fe-2S) protein [Chloroflexota bacterium]